MIMVCVFIHETIIPEHFCMILCAFVLQLHCKLEGFFRELRESFFVHSTEWLFLKDSSDYLLYSHVLLCLF